MKELIESIIKNKVDESNVHGMFREPLIGFSSAGDPLFAELKEIIGSHHFLPDEILPGAETVISFFIPFSKQVVESNRNCEGVSKEWAVSYIECNKLINEISELLVSEIEARGAKAEMVRATHNYDPKDLKAPWSHKSAAFIAGLGSFGKNRLLITPKGCAGRFGSVILSEKIEFSERTETNRCTYKSNGGCHYCLKNCPIGALSENSFGRHACHDRLLSVNDSFPELEKCDVCGKCAVGPCAYF